MNRKRFVQFFIGILISIIFLFLSVRNVQFREVLDAFQNARYIYVVYAVILTILALFIRSVRWKFILNQSQKPRLYNLFAATCIGLMSSNVLPFRLGDFVQAYFLGRKEKIGKTFVFSTVMLERLFDLVMLLIFFGISSLLVTVSAEIRGIKFVAGAGFLGIIIVILFLRYGKKTEGFFIRLFSHFSVRIASKISSRIDSFISGLRVIQQGKSLIKIVLISIIGWLINISVLWTVFLAFGIDKSLPIVTIVITITLISVMIPSSPGYIGTWEYFGVFALGLFNVEKSIAFGCVLVHHMTQYLTILILGLFFLAREGISLKEVENISEGRNKTNG